MIIDPSVEMDAGIGQPYHKNRDEGPCPHNRPRAAGVDLVCDGQKKYVLH